MQGFFFCYKGLLHRQNQLESAYDPELGAMERLRNYMVDSPCQFIPFVRRDSTPSSTH